MQIGDIVGKSKELMAPSMRIDDLKSATPSVDDQRLRLIDYEYKVCRAFTPCADASMRDNRPETIRLCNDSAIQLAKVQIPSALPTAVIKNLEIYHQSMINGAKNISKSWDTIGKDGGTFWTYIFNWEIDTCSTDSIPHKVYRLYDLPITGNTKNGICEQIELLFHAKKITETKAE